MSPSARHSGNTFCLECILLLTKGAHEIVSRNMCCLSCPGCNLTVLHDIDTLSAWFLRTGVRSRVVRRTFMGLVWLAVSVVARLSSRVLQLRRQVNAVCGRRQRANTARLLWLRLWPARHRQTSTQLILKHWHKKKTKQPWRLSTFCMF